MFETRLHKSAPPAGRAIDRWFSRSVAVMVGLGTVGLGLGCGSQPAPYADAPGFGPGQAQSNPAEAADPTAEPSTPAPDASDPIVGHGPEPGLDEGSETSPVEAPEIVEPAGPPVVEFGEPKFTSGDVPNVVANLNKLKDTIAKCVVDSGGITAEQAEISLQFLVRAQGKAEGVDINKSKALKPDAVQCVKNALKNKWVGTPSADPIGVTITIALRKASS